MKSDNTQATSSGIFHRSMEGRQKDVEEKGQPVSRVHVDYTVKSGPERLQAVLPDEAERLMKTPFAVLQVKMSQCQCASALSRLSHKRICMSRHGCTPRSNQHKVNRVHQLPSGSCCSCWLSAQVWRPLRGPVDDSPLGIIDAASVAKEDLMSYALYFPGRVGYNYVAKYSPNHRQGLQNLHHMLITCYNAAVRVTGHRIHM